MIIYIIPIIVFGVISIYTDMTEKLIKNKLIVAMLLTSTALHAYHLLFFPELFNFLHNFAINIAFSIAIGIMLWAINLWPAGDAKLFIAYSSMLPMSFFSPGNHFLSFDFLINTFVPIFFFMFVFMMVKSKKSEIRKSLRFTFDPYTIFMVFIILAGFMWFIMKSLAFLGVFMNYFIIIILLFLILEIINKVVPINMEYFYVFLVILRLVLDYRTVFTISYLYELLYIIFAYIIVRYFVIDLGFHVFTKPTKIKDLKPGMCLAEGIMKSGEKDVNYEKKRMVFFSFIQAMSEKRRGDFIHSISFDGLSDKDVEKIKKLRKESKIPFDEIMIHSSTPFAMFLLIGIILTFLFQTNFVTYLKGIL